ncbi:MAG: hypothetical protein GXX96_37615 [Planctomycetaceae bacterium]|nr:hypothetical protein [Planctomycetaceae bacterium]
MMDGLHTALRHYERIRPEAREELTSRVADELNAWMEGDACQVVQELLPHPDFRRHASWPIERLVSTSLCAERCRVQAVDDALVAYAGELAVLAGQPANRQQLLLMEDQETPVARDLVAGSTGGDQAAGVERVPRLVTQLEWIADRPWIDLVSVADYFHSVSQLNLRQGVNEDSGLQPQLAAFLPYSNVRLRQLGDLVSRSMLTRVEFWADYLRRAEMRCHEARRRVCQGEPQPEERVIATQLQLRESRDTLETLFHGEEADLRDGCIGLVQVIAAYRPMTELSWLGEVAQLSANAAAIRDRVRRVGLEVTDPVAKSLGQVWPLYRQPIMEEEIIERACREHRLVMVCGVGFRAVYWKGEEVTVDWRNKTLRWEFLLGLAEAAMKKQGVDAFLEKTGRGPKPLKDRKARLKQDLPADLYELIQPAGRGTYKLDLPPEEIGLLEYDEESRLVSHGNRFPPV